MDWARVIDRNRAILLRIVAALCAMAGMADGAMPGTLARHRHNAVRRILRTAESALRRLVIIAARDIADIPLPIGAFMYGLDRDKAGRRRAGAAQDGKDGAAVPPFALTDPVKRFCFAAPARRPKGFPRVTILGLTDPTPIPAGWVVSPDDEIDARPLCRRILSVERALGDIEGQARRLARLQARRDKATGETIRRSPMRAGPPPGRRLRSVHEVDAVLADLDTLARCALSPDSS